MHRGFIVAALVLSLPFAGVAAVAAGKRIVVIGGVKSEGPARHEYPEGVRILKAILESSPELQRAGVKVDTYDDWPDGAGALRDAAALVWYFDGDERDPLLEGARRERFETLMRNGAGLVALHQSSTVPAGGGLTLAPWLGAERRGLYDRATQDVRLSPATPTHPVSRGVAAFLLHDEFYPTFQRLEGGARATPILEGMLRPEYRAGRELDNAPAERAAVAWAFQRPSGGRSFTYSGGHFLAALDAPMLRKTLLNAIAWSAGIEVPRAGMTSGVPDIASQAARERTDMPTFHRDARRSGWNPHETALTPARVEQGPFGLTWESPALDGIDGQGARLYASPLYVDRLRLTRGQHQDRTFSVVLAASNTGFVYAINASRVGDVPPGTILWRTRLAAPCRLQPAPLDAVPTGVLSTPVVDARRGRLYVTSCDPARGWQAYALDLGSGALLNGWPVRLDEATLNSVNRNAGPPVAPTRRFDFRVQRGALNLSPDGAWLYVTFGETETGWIAAIDTAKPRVASAYAAQAVPHRGGGGMWGAGGPAIDTDGHIYVVTGTGYNGYVDRERDWTQSVLKLAHGERGFDLVGTYTPFNHCASATMDIDLGSGGATLFDVEAARSPAKRLMVVGGKQGNAYLLDRARLPGRLDRRPACSDEPASDASLLAPGPQPQFSARGPLNVFGPYSEKDAAMDTARARSVPASFRHEDGRTFVFLTGSTRPEEGSTQSIPPSLVRLQVVSMAGEPAYLRIDQREMRHAFENPGSPFVTSRGGRHPIVWVLDENAKRSALLAGPGAPKPVLYAFDAMTLELLWKSAPGELQTSGKYNQPAVARGMVFVGTDRIQAFGLGGVGRFAPAAPKPAPESAPARDSVIPHELPRSSGPRDVRAVYAQRCAACHDNPQGSIPPREVLAKLPRQRIVEALTMGAMRAHAEGLDRAEVEALAGYLQ